MTKTNSIVSFPADEDRNAFGHWLSGFTDGEGCFNLYFTTHQTPGAAFTIGLRQDDRSILELAQSFWGCGRVYLNSRMVRGKEYFVAQYSTYCAADLARVIVPHFERYPLRSKKSRDYSLWKQAVAIIAGGHRRGNRRDTGRYGKRWTDEEVSQFTVLFTALRSLREFKAPDISSIPPPLPPPEEDYPLFQ